MKTNPPPYSHIHNPTQDQDCNRFQPIPQTLHTYSTTTRPPHPRNIRGTPWCDCCTAQISDDDTQTGLRDPGIPGTRYMLLCADHHTPPSHSNQHLDYIHIFPSNAAYHTAQRDAQERYQARTGILPPSQPTSTYTNTPSYTDIGPTIAHLQYERYRACGGRKARGPHHSDHAYKSPCRANMTPGETYRRWFHDHISRQHYSLGEATDHYDDWLNMAPHPLLQPHSNPIATSHRTTHPRAKPTSSFTAIRPRTKQQLPLPRNTQPRPSPDHRAGRPHISRRRQRCPR